MSGPRIQDFFFIKERPSLYPWNTLILIPIKDGVSYFILWQLIKEMELNEESLFVAKMIIAKTAEYTKD